MKAVILAAGEGTRMRPLTADTPKPLLPVAGKPIVRHTVGLLRPHVDGFVIVAGYRGEMVEDEFEDDEDVKVVRQEERLGTAHAALQASNLVEGRTAVVNGDDLFGEAALEALEHEKAVVGSRVENPGKFGVLKAENGELERIVEKPEGPETDLVNTGFYVVGEDFFELLEEVEESRRGELEITDAVKSYQDSFQIVEDPEWKPCSYPWQLLRANRQLLNHVERAIDGDVDGSASVKGPVCVEDGAQVRENAVLEGPAVVSEDAVVGPGSHIRPGTVIHPGAEVSGSEVKNSVIREDVEVPHQSYIGDSYLNPGVHVGAGAKTANLRHDGNGVMMEVKGELMDTGMRKLGAVIGSEAEIGVNCSVKPGRKIGKEALVDAHEKVETNLPSYALLKDGEIVEDWN